MHSKSKVVAVALVLAVSTAFADDAPKRLEVESALIKTPSNSEGVEVQGGCWLSAEQCKQSEAEVTRLRAENHQLQTRNRTLLVGVLVGVAAGVGIGYGLAQYIR